MNPNLNNGRATLTRRSFIGAASAAAVTLYTAGCGTNGNDDGAPADDAGGVRGGSLAMPTYQPFGGVKPDLPGNELGVPSAYFAFPRPAVQAFASPPLSGGTITAMMTLAGGAVPAPMGRNRWWQGLNERLGAELDVDLSTGEDYASKFASVVAGGALPDIVQIQPKRTARMPDLLAAEFEDLTEFLGGDAILEYPFLANLPSTGWRSTVFNGAIFGVPPQNIVGNPTWITRRDVFDQLGVDPAPADADAFLQMCIDVTDTAVNRYALAQPPNVINNLAGSMFDAPHGWGVDEAGGFTHMFETDEYRAALDFTARLWDAGVFHPDSFGSVQIVETFNAGTLVLRTQGGTSYPLPTNVAGLDLGFFSPPLAEGGGSARKRLDSGTFQLAAVRKQDSKDRVRELLSVMNYLAAPFGTEEWLFQHYGEEGVHHTWDADLQAPIRTEALAIESFPAIFLGGPPLVIFNPGNQDVAEEFYSHQAEDVPNGLYDASLGLYSATNDSEGEALTQAVDDVRNDVIQGRKTIDDFERAVSDWRNSGGDRIRQEFEDAYAELNA